MRVRPSGSTRTGRRVPSVSTKKRLPRLLAARRGQVTQADGSHSPAHGPSEVSRQCSVTISVGAEVRLRPSGISPASSRAMAAASSLGSSSGSQTRRAPKPYNQRAVPAFHTEMGAAASQGTPALRAMSICPKLRQTTAATLEHSSWTRGASAARLTSSKMTVKCGSNGAHAASSSSRTYAGTSTSASRA